MPHLDITVHNNTPFAFAIRDRQDSARTCTTTINFADTLRVGERVEYRENELPTAAGTWNTGVVTATAGRPKVQRDGSEHSFERDEIRRSNGDVLAFNGGNNTVPPWATATLQLRAHAIGSPGGGLLGTSSLGLVGLVLLNVALDGKGLQGALRLVSSDPQVAVSLRYDCPVVGDDTWSAEASDQSICKARAWPPEGTYTSSDGVRAQHWLCTIAPDPAYMEQVRKSKAKQAAKLGVATASVIAAAVSGGPTAIAASFGLLCKAIMEEDVGTIQKLVAAVPGLLAQKNAGGETPMQLAVSRGKKDALAAMCAVVVPEGVPPKSSRKA